MTIRNYKLQVINHSLITDSAKNKGISSVVPVGMVLCNALTAGACSSAALSTRVAVDLALTDLIRRRPISADQLLGRTLGSRLFGHRAPDNLVGRRDRLERRIANSRGNVDGQCHLGTKGRFARRCLQADRMRFGRNQSVTHTHLAGSVASFPDGRKESCRFHINVMGTGNACAPLTWYQQSYWPCGGEQ